MEFKDDCAVCFVPMTRHLKPCGHIFHKKCIDRSGGFNLCPICRITVLEFEDMTRSTYNLNNSQDRERILQCANKGDDWVSLAQSLEVKYKTAYGWVRSGRPKMFTKGGHKPKKLNQN